MVIAALPTGILILLDEHFQFQSDGQWATIAAAAMTLPMATIGGLFLAIATLIFESQGPKNRLSN
jgi:hypothetical protein